MSHLSTRTAALLAAGTLALTGLGTASAQATPHAAHGTVAKAPATDPLPLDQATAWLGAQLTGGLIHNEQYDFDDIGLSIDTALGLDAAGKSHATVDAVSNAVAAHINSYISGDPGDPGSTYAGATAKALVLAETASANPVSYGGVNLVARLEAQVSSTSPTTGRISDTSTYGNYANTLGQSYAATGLFLAHSTKAAAATAFLLEQQCPAGWFRLSFSDPSATDQSCAAATDSPNTDATAIAIIELQQQRGTTGVQAAITKAIAWLGKTQATDGSFGSSTPTTAANANSTGLAGWALGVSGRTGAAAKAAVWVRQRQLVGIAACQPFAKADVGALAYDDAGYTSALTTKIAAATQDQYRRATAQALPVLAYAPGPANGGGSSGSLQQFYRPGATVKIEQTGQAAGSPACGQVGKNAKKGNLSITGADRKAAVTVTLPQKTGRYLVKGTVENGATTTHAQVLGAQTIGFSFAKAKVPARGTQTVRVRGLVKGELVRVSFRGKVVARGLADKNGAAVLKFSVLKKAGSFPVTVTGQFADIRKNTKSFTVTS